MNKNEWEMMRFARWESDGLTGLKGYWVIA